MLQGSMVALVTPFKNDTFDEAAYKKLIDWQITNGTDAIVPCGTTGESPTLTHDEHNRVVQTAIEAAKGRVPVVAGTGSNSTKEAVALTRHAAKAGADACLVVTPYYNKPSQEGLYRHFKAVAESADISIVLYNIEGRAARNIEPATMARLARDCKNIVGVKEASGSLSQMQAVKELCPENFLLISGDDVLTLPMLSIGGVGVISVVANIVPQTVADLIDTYAKGDIEGARRRHYKLLPLVRAMFIDTNPVPVKTAMGLMGLCSTDMRLPLCPMSETNTQKLKSVLTEYGLLK